MVTRLDAAYDREVLAVRTRVLAFTARSWDGLTAYRDADAERLIAKLVPRIEAGQKRVAELTDAYLTRVARLELGIASSQGAVASVTTEALRGVPADEVYRRPFVTAYTALADGNAFNAAVASGAARLQDIVSTGLQLAKTHSAQAQIERSQGVGGFRRVLTGRENCSLCVIASTQRYHRGDLMPIHPGCDCGVKSFKGDPNVQVIEPDLLESVHTAVENEFGGSDRGARYLDGRNDRSDFLDLIVTRDHGEIGPVLTWREQHFAGPGDIAA